MSNAWTKLKQHVRRRFLIGVVVFAPFGLTIWVLVKLILWGKGILTKPIAGLLEWELKERWPDLLSELYDPRKQQFILWVDLSVLVASIVLVLVFLYIIGILSATFFGRRYISLGETLLRRVPGAQFVYGVIKQLIEILSKPKSNAFKQVVLVEFPRKGLWCLAFFTGVTRRPETDEVLVNIFLPSVPNPTTGFLMFARPDEIRLTTLTVAEASRMIFSFGVVAESEFDTKPFLVEAYTGKKPGAAAEARERIPSPTPPSPDTLEEQDA